VPRRQQGGGRESVSDEDVNAQAQWRTSTPNLNPGLTTGRLPRVMHLGLNSKLYAHDPRASTRKFFVGSGGGGGGTNDPERQRPSDEPSVLRLARNSTAYLDYSDSAGDSDNSDEGRGGGDAPPPHKRSKHHGVAEISTFSTSSSDGSYRIPQPSFQRGSDDDEDTFSDVFFLRTLSPIDYLGQMLREGQRRDDGSATEAYQISSATPYFFQPDRWSCGKKNPAYSSLSSSDHSFAHRLMFVFTRLPQPSDAARQPSSLTNRRRQEPHFKGT